METRELLTGGNRFLIQRRGHDVGAKQRELDLGKPLHVKRNTTQKCGSNTHWGTGAPHVGKSSFSGYRRSKNKKGVGRNKH